MNELRFALWGAVDDGTTAVGTRVAEAAPGSDLHTRHTTDRALRDTIRRVDASVTPPALMEWLRREVSGRRPGTGAPAASAQTPSRVSPAADPWEIPQFGDPRLLYAVPLPAAAGARGGPADDRLVICANSAFELEVDLSVDRFAGSAAVTGRLRGGRREPLAGRTITLVVDLEPRASADTDQFGEFSFDHVCGAAFWLRIADGETVHHVVLGDLEAETSERDSPD